MRILYVIPKITGFLSITSQKQLEFSPNLFFFIFLFRYLNFIILEQEVAGKEFSPLRYFNQYS